MLDLKNLNWKPFDIGGTNGLFLIRSSSSGIDKNKINIEEEKNKTIPYVTRSNINNGIADFISKNQASKYHLDKGGVITIGLDTQTIFYQPTDFYTGQNIQVLEHKEIDLYTSLFMIPLLNIQMEKFNWGGNGATLSRLNRTKIMLPVNERNEVHWDFIREKGRDILYFNRKKYLDFKENIFKCFTPFTIESLEKKEWKDFKVRDIFQLEKCKCSNASILEDGFDIPYVGATNRNNGTMKFVKINEKMITKGNCIVFICDGQGSVGYSIYKNEDFIGSTTLRAGRNEYLNKYNSKFLTCALDKNKSLYDYGYKRKEPRLLNESIMLPINENGEIDWDYMTKFIKNLEYKKFIEYKNFLN